MQTAFVKTCKNTTWQRIKSQRYLLLLLLPGLVYYIIFRYIPMYGTIIAFKNFDFRSGILGSEWVGLKYFKQFVTGPYFWRLVKNTFLISFYDLLFSFPAPIVFALLLNEVKAKKYKKLVQTVSYLPHFISVVILVGLMKTMFSPNGGVVNNIIQAFGFESINFFMEKGGSVAFMLVPAYGRALAGDQSFILLPWQGSIPSSTKQPIWTARAGSGVCGTLLYPVSDQP